jgi:hypothetical protein
MPDLYEIAVVACTSEASGGNVLRLEHRFPSIPDLETLRALKNEVAGYYTSLYGDDPDVLQIVATRLTSQDVATQEKITPVEWDWRAEP